MFDADLEELEIALEVMTVHTIEARNRGEALPEWMVADLLRLSAAVKKLKDGTIA